MTRVFAWPEGCWSWHPAGEAFRPMCTLAPHGVIERDYYDRPQRTAEQRARVLAALTPPLPPWTGFVILTNEDAL